MSLAVTSAHWDGNAIHSTHFVNWSIITKILVLPEVDSGNGPKNPDELTPWVPQYDILSLDILPSCLPFNAYYILHTTSHI